MTTPSYVLLEKITVGAAGAASVTFSGIPQTGYTDLVVKICARTEQSAVSQDLILQFNGDTGANYTTRRLEGNGTGAASDTATSGALYGSFMPMSAASATANTFGNGEAYIPNYTGSALKSFSTDSVAETNATATKMSMCAALWNNTAAITSILIRSYAGNNLVQYSTFYLYGVAKLGTTPAIVPYATGGDTIMTDGTYWYHAFTSSGTFTPAKTLSCDVLTVAGGGGGGGGGGGAGGVLYSAAQSFATAQTVTIGAGASNNLKGSNSSVGSLVATGGGAAGNQGALSNGGSGGGNDTNAAGGTGIAGQGNNGGAGVAFVTNCGFGGGGGASAVGGNATTTTGGVGGAGTNTYTAWHSLTQTGVGGYIAGGGGGGCGTGTTGLGPNAGVGGAGGGGQGGVYVAGQNATVNTGSGGGGSYGTAGGYGGSGLVIVRYAV